MSVIVAPSGQLAENVTMWKTRALKRVNKGGGVRQWNDDKYVYDKKVEGSDYVVFNCPACGQRNKKCISQAREMRKEDLALFLKCNHCVRVIEVTPPLGVEVGTKSIIISP